MDMISISQLVRDAGLQCFDGYAITGAKLPYVVNRPLILQPEGELTLCGGAIGWDNQFTLYCAAGSPEASYNLAKMVMSLLQGKRVLDSTLATSMGYSGAPVEGHYESQVTVQVAQGEI